MAGRITSPFGGYYIYPNDPNNLFQQIFGGSKERSHTERSSELTPAVDVYEDDGAFYASVEMPGVKKENVHITFSDGDLTINAEVGRSEHDNGHWVQHERRVGTYVRSISFRADIVSDNISANYENGVLNLTIPKKSAKSKSVSISID